MPRPLADPGESAPGARARRRRRLWIAVGAVALGLLALGLLADQQALRSDLAAAAAAVTAWVDSNPVAAIFAFIAFAAFGKISPLPGGMVVMLSGGFLFGALGGGVLAAAGSAMAAGGVATVGRWVLGPPALRRSRRDARQQDGHVPPDRWRSRLAVATEAVERNGFVAILTLRLLPMTPAWLANLVPLVVSIPTLHVMLATFLGVLPLSVVAAAVGSRLADLSQATELDWRAFTAPETIIPLLALTALALLPVVVARLRRRR
jgi:uncharacterized membrane protein YdjX (TVP38/TMEM64 family)